MAVFKGEKSTNDIMSNGRTTGANESHLWSLRGTRFLLYCIFRIMITVITVVSVGKRVSARNLSVIQIGETGGQKITLS